MRLCIPTLNRYDLLARLIESAEAGTVKPTGYYIIDNGGGFRVEAIASLMTLGEGCVHRPSQNLGVSPSWNKFLALREPIIISNDDIVLKPHALETIERELETRPFVQAFGFALFGITPECVERVGYFDEKFFPAYFEDCDYEIRMRRAGVLRARYAEGELAEHGGWSTTEKAREEGEEKAEWLTKAPEKNRVYFVQKWGAVTGHCSGGGDDPPEIFQEPFNGSPPAGWAREQRCPPKPMRWDIINRIAGITRAESYLEIGVADGESMRHVDIPTRHGVDPMPSPGGQRACTTYFPYSSKCFFEEVTAEEGKLKQYDVIFIDGDHKAELVYYEIQKALELVSPTGVIVIHDCNPATEAMQTDEYQGGFWNGTVWKAIARVRAEGKHGLRVVDSDYGVGILVPFGDFDPGNTVPIDEANPWAGLSYDALEAGRSWMLGITSGWEWEEWFRSQWLSPEDLARIDSARDRVMAFAAERGGMDKLADVLSPDARSALEKFSRAYEPRGFARLMNEAEGVAKELAKVIATTPEPSNYFPSDGNIDINFMNTVRERFAASVPPNFQDVPPVIHPPLALFKKTEPEEIELAVLKKRASQGESQVTLGYPPGECPGYGPDDCDGSCVRMLDDADGADEPQRTVEYLEYDPTKHNEEDLKGMGYKTPGWYHYDETGAYMYGPFPTSEEAHAGLEAYAKSLKP